MTRKTTKRALLYCRVSSKSQLKGDGLNSQEFRCREYARDRGYEVEAVFPDSQTAKGDFMDRPGMVALLAYLDAQDGADFVVIFDDLKRFARDTEFHLNLRRVLGERSASVECLNFKFEDTPEGRFIETVIAAQGQLDREQNARQTRQKSEARLMQGYWVFQAPLGYKYVPAQNGGKILVRNEPVASIIEDYLTGYASGRFTSVAEICRHVEGIPEYPKNTPAGGVRTQNVIDIIKNPIYSGQIDARCWNIKAKGQHEPLITLETFQRNQKRMKARSFTTTRKDTHEDFPLRGSVACSSCGKPLTGGWAKGSNRHYAYYWCCGTSCKLKGKTIPRDKIEGEFAKLLRAMTPAKVMVDIFHDLLRTRWDQRGQELSQNKDALSKESSKIDSDISSLISRIVETSNPRIAAAYEERIEELQLQKQVVAEKALNLGKPIVPFDDLFEHAVQFLSSPKKLWDSGELALRRLVIRLSFADHLQYARGVGFEHPNYSGPFNIINDLGGKMSQFSNDFTRSCKMVPPAGLEPALPKKTDFESVASTNSATGARKMRTR